ncbi:MAG: hypothetical protein HXY48_14995, partial [Ignavibacteriaceae bacterium]|nr:hypothetical protein [Ignavibacteriaceae bacterium]
MIYNLKNIKACILLLIALLLILTEINAQNIPLGHFSVQEGLSNSFVNCLIQDRTGFIWFGTDDGLNRFDGYDVKVFRSNPNDKSSISENIIWALWEDHVGNLWIGTKSGGLNKYDPNTDRFEHWDLDSNTVGEINITYIYEDSKKYIWVGTYRNGIYRFNPLQNKFEHWQNTAANPNVLSNNFVTSIIEDQNSNIWIATFAGLDKFIHHQTDVSFKKVLPDFNNPIWYMTKSGFFNNAILMGTLKGLIKFEPLTQEFSQIELPADFGSQFGNSVSSITEVEYAGEKILWAGTFGGLVRINLTTGYKERIIQSKKVDSDLLSNQIHDIILDKSGVVWIASENGVNFYSLKHSKFNSKTPA